MLIIPDSQPLLPLPLPFQSIGAIGQLAVGLPHSNLAKRTPNTAVPLFLYAIAKKALSNCFVYIWTSRLLYLGLQWIFDVTASFCCAEHREVSKATSLMIFRSLPAIS